MSDDNDGGRWPLAGLGLVAGIVFVLSTGCGPPATPSSPVPTVGDAVAPARSIVIGDVDAEEPAKKIKRYQPLADFLAQRLQPLGISQGRVVIARNFDEMAGFLRNGTVDIYVDSPFPILKVQELAGSEIILRSWKEENATYWSVYIARKDSGVARVEDLVGKVMALEERQSTSGFVLPAGTLLQRGFAMREVDRRNRQAAPNEIGYFFSRDEKNTLELVLRGIVAGAGISNEDYQQLPDETKQQIVTFDQTVAVPRQLVAVRPGLEPELVLRIRDLLMGLDQTDDGQKMLKGLKNTARFDPLPVDAEAQLSELRALMELVSSQ